MTFILFMLYLIFDVRRFNRESSKNYREFRNDCISKIKTIYQIEPHFIELDANQLELVKDEE